MSLLKMLMEAKGGEGLGQLARQIGMDEAQAGGLAGMLGPAISQGAKRRAQSGGLEQVLNQLRGEGQASYLEEPATAAGLEARAQGEQFLEQLLGDRQAGNELAAEASNRTGIDLDMVMKFLPAMAAMMQGAMQKNMPDTAIDGMMESRRQADRAGGGGLMDVVGGLLGGGGGQSGPQSGGGLDMLTDMLDADGDGSAMDDILDRFLKR